jgi:hypothetical protein
VKKSREKQNNVYSRNERKKQMHLRTDKRWRCKCGFVFSSPPIILGVDLLITRTKIIIISNLKHSMARIRSFSSLFCVKDTLGWLFLMFSSFSKAPQNLLKGYEPPLPQGTMRHGMARILWFYFFFFCRAYAGVVSSPFCDGS